MNKKILVIGDNHIYDKTPSTRNDNYLESTTNKLRECIQYGRDLNVDAIILLGDLFHEREVGPEARNKVLKILIEDRKFPIYITVGNHDIKSSYPLEKTTLGTLIESGVLIKTDYAEDLDIAFAHFHPDLDQNIKNGFLASKDCLIWSCHASIADKKNMFEEFLVMFDDIEINERNMIVFSGHIHQPMEYQREDKKIFLNPGAIGRTSANKDNLSRDLKILYFEYSLKGEIIEKKYLPLKSARHHTEVFKIEEINVAKAQKEDVKNFIKQVSYIRNNNWAVCMLEDKLKTLKDLAKKSNLSDDVAEIAIEAVRCVNDKDCEEK